MGKRKFQIDQLIINSPYEEPSTYWSYDREVRMFERMPGRRSATPTNVRRRAATGGCWRDRTPGWILATKLTLK